MTSVDASRDAPVSVSPASANRATATTTATTASSRAAAPLATRPSQQQLPRSSASSSPSSARHPDVLAGYSSLPKSVVSDDVDMGDVVPRGRADRSSHHSSAAALSANSAERLRGDDDDNGAVVVAAEASTASPRPLQTSATHDRRASPLARGEGSWVRSQRSATAASTTTTTTATSARATAAAPAAQQPPPPSSPPLSEQQRRRQHQQQQQRPTLGVSPSSPSAAAAAAPSPSSSPQHQPYHSATDVVRVRAALADAGYPNPSWQDIERVFAQMAETRHDNVGQPSDGRSRQGATVDDLGYSYPTRVPPSNEKNSSSLLPYVEPALRLERYIQLRERELENMFLHPTAAAAVTIPPSPAPRGEDHARGHAPAARPAGHTAPSRPHSTVATMAAKHRRAANIVFNITGDQRFRFFSCTRTPQGSGALVCSSPRTTRAVHAAAAASGQDRTRSGTALPSPSFTPVHRSPVHNFYNPERGGGGGGHHHHQHGSASSYLNPNSGPSVLSSNSVAYLDPQGCTLRRKADPVKRGQQMRLLWEKDNFLSQRRRPQEAWRTRQITMAYGQEATGE
ncbi:hypothetical protein ABB37_09669 [Leptomonas pyrrhocoris]|uniref:Uncharacterized protein n=1 Tax=Leptomonas pyrrhocoris TaxID=157538 RepID=A0A0M9FQ94_LEPPY|nr:hypothetical protein ABB37_09669 [Leptomonas pyrrhocoris]XP_015652223.1 hypothetical protein ABB37_09669 [Leptomonas pyrrhocoris]XP_015652224.1 hypothetical protein ABB37_09669 [Leptomonas pyrrhocoris]KPA73783.1 hypothetical protein ABB37_09669 [Leptomonas pyrrhocoris]KPA73784.1 hypothetical protein ABB37_09669 [Leptomonas pyrrhocoris]KPA73785.1 hypothetical protein ABB37_09669 [Leptomonas pyrrhocoris]|eukprot:XP_015652222.1 hypothetical protein ABB37_09669 [Leptomonas pyrrhocoris]